MKDNSYLKWADIFKTIGHPIRIKIIETLLENEKCVRNIWKYLDLPQSTVSQHLSILRSKGIVENEREGSSVKYFVRDRKIEEIIKIIKSNK
ncbi:MAG: metalloregulator ArsR/SmtB family transcription factor [Proteobacteria bacterium]|nr:metalloregulator ArsR/SmtB family transcription factor [Pseudomonadota bacterium]